MLAEEVEVLKSEIASVSTKARSESDKNLKSLHQDTDVLKNRVEDLEMNDATFKSNDANILYYNDLSTWQFFTHCSCMLNRI